MRVAHFGIFAPHASGQYETIKDLILAERSIGIDAQFIDCGSDDKLTIRENLEDRGIKTMPLDWALNKADIAVRHSVVPDEVFKKIPVVLALHGRPENSFRLEYTDKMPVISGILKAAHSRIYRDIFTFWPEHVFFWENIIGNGKVNIVPPPVNLDEFTPTGEKHDFGKFKTKINLMIADIWRDDSIPFNLIFAAQYFRNKYFKDTKVHIYGISNVKKDCFSFMSHMQKEGVVGEVSGVIGYLPKIYRAADVLLTSNNIATRIVREAMASGLPVVAPHGCSFASHTAEPKDYKAYADAIAKTYHKVNNKKGRAKIRARAEKEFGFKAVGDAMKSLLEKAIKTTPINVASKKTLTNQELVDYGKAYCKTVTTLEHGLQRTMRRNERAIEIAYVFKQLTKYYPSTVLDVGTGRSSLPHLMSSVRFEVDAIDEKGNYWKEGMFNRHFKVDKQDITNHTIKRHYDLITCVSTLEHIFNHEAAVRNMLNLLNPEGVLIITVPYCEDTYIPNIYKHPESGYGHNFDYICQVFSRNEVESWGGKVIDQEYWKVFHGKFWTVGRQYYPPIKSTKEDLHQLTCITMVKQ